jgi:hypothetical protein
MNQTPTRNEASPCIKKAESPRIILMKKKIRKLLIISGAVFSFILILLIISSLFFYYNKSITKRILEKYIADKAGAKLEIGKLDYDLFPFSVQADSVKVFQEIRGMEIDIFIKQLSLEGEIKRLLKKQKSTLSSIEANGAVFRIFIREEEEEMEVDYQENMLLVSDILSYAVRINFEDFSIKYITSSYSVDFEGGSFYLSGSDNKGEFDYSITGAKALIGNTDSKVSLESSLSSSGKFSLIGLPSFEGEILLESIDFAQIEERILLPEISLRTKVEFRFEEKLLVFPQFEMNVPPFFDAAGNLKMDLGEDFSFVSLSKINLKDLNKTHVLLKPYLMPYLSPQLKTLALEGGALLEGEYHYIKDPSGAKLSVKSQVKLKPTHMSCTAPGFSFENLISGEIRVEGLLPDINFSGSLGVKNGNFSKDDLKIKDLSLDLSLSGINSSSGNSGVEGSLTGIDFSGSLRVKHGDFSKGDLRIKDFSLDLSLSGSNSFLDASRFKCNLKSLSLPVENKSVELDQVEFRGKGSYDVAGGKIALDHLELQIPPLPPFQISSKVDLHPDGERYFYLKSPPMDSGSLLTLFSSFVPKEVSEVEPSCHFDLERKASKTPQDGDEWSFSGNFNLSEGAFHNPPFTLASESLQQKINLQGNYHPVKKRAKFSVELDISKGESLWNEYYVDWGKNPFRANVSGAYDVLQNRLDDFSLEASLFPLGKIEVRGLLGFQEPNLYDLEILASELNLNSLYAFFYQEQAPEQPALDLKGEAESKIRLMKDKDKLSITGQIQVRNASLENKEKEILMEGIEVEIPVYYENQIKENDEKEESFLKEGYFRVKKFESPFLSMAPLQIDFLVGRNKFMIEPVTAEIFGGKAVLGKSIFFIGSKPSDVHGTLSFSLSDMDLSLLPLESDRFSLSGLARLNLSHIEIGPEELVTKGKGEVDAFDTRINVENIKIARPFSQNRTISCDIEFKDLNLEKLTDSIPFGRVTGILRGEIKDLAFSYGQPESFIMNLESIKRKGMPQKFSVRAVNDLSIISSGEQTAISSKKGLTRFIQEFGYKKIGIFCSLKNDIFSLNGTIKKKGVEYLVQRSWLFGISVVNKKPRNRIRFKDMMDRLKRIGQSEEPSDQTDGF